MSQPSTSPVIIFDAHTHWLQSPPVSLKECDWWVSLQKTHGSSAVQSMITLLAGHANPSLAMVQALSGALFASSAPENPISPSLTYTKLVHAGLTKICRQATDHDVASAAFSAALAHQLDVVWTQPLWRNLLSKLINKKSAPLWSALLTATRQGTLTTEQSANWAERCCDWVENGHPALVWFDALPQDQKETLATHKDILKKLIFMAQTADRCQVPEPVHAIADHWPELGQAAITQTISNVRALLEALPKIQSEMAGHNYKISDVMSSVLTQSQIAVVNVMEPYMTDQACCTLCSLIDENDPSDTSVDPSSRPDWRIPPIIRAKAQRLVLSGENSHFDKAEALPRHKM